MSCIQAWKRRSEYNAIDDEWKAPVSKTVCALKSNEAGAEWQKA